MKLGFIRLVTLGVALLVAGCMDSTSPTDLSPGLVILDAEHGDEGSHFYFLPPLVPDPGATGIFDATQPAVVEICEWTGLDCALTITELSVDAGTINVSVEDEHYRRSGTRAILISTSPNCIGLVSLLVHRSSGSPMCSP